MYFSTYFVAEDAGKSEKVCTANCHADAAVFEDHGADAEPAECTCCGIRWPDAARDGKERVGGDIANGNSRAELCAGCLGMYQADGCYNHEH